MLDDATARRRRAVRAGWAAVDSACWTAGLVGTVWLRFDFAFPQGSLPLTITLALIVVILQVALGSMLGPYRIGHDRGSYEETSDLARTTLITTALGFVIASLWHPDMLPRSAPVTGGALALVAMLALRLMVRSRGTRMALDRNAHASRALVYGAGQAGRRLVRSALREMDSPVVPVALLDDDPAKGRLRIEGVPVRGRRADLPRVAQETGAEVLVLAITDLDAGVRREVTAAATDAGLQVKVLPSMAEMMGDPDTVSLRDLNLADLLGRRPIQLDETAISRELAGRRVLVTGAGGSIGSELCRQIAQFSPARLILLDRDESALHATRLSLNGDSLLLDENTVLADIRDADVLREIFDRVRPEVVFHAAALKHLPLLERYPTEAWKTNVLGTLNVLNAAAGAGVGTFVNVSTDKAADPTSTLGYSKRLTERLTAGFAAREAGRYVSVRFGNVLGSRGSVVPAFTAQIERGGPVTVTDPEVKRYFMLIPEACQLVLEAAAIGGDGDVLVLDMGEQVKIVDVAHALIQMSGRRDVAIVYTGLRPGEKLGEDLFAGVEERFSTGHPLVQRVRVPPLAADAVLKPTLDGHAEAKAWMRSVACPSQVGNDTARASKNEEVAL